MTSFNHILCPVDSSEFAKRALGYGAALARVQGAELTVLTVRPPMTLDVWAAHNLVLPPELPEARDQTAAALRQFVQETTGLDDARVIVQDGPVVGEILRVAAEWPADLIVMGTHGASGFERIVIGSVTEKVLRRTPVPVLTIPRHARDVSSALFRTVLCALDRSEAAGRALEYALELARAGGGRLVLTHVVEHIVDEDPQFARHFDTAACYHALEPELRAWYAARVPPEARAACDLDVQLRFGKASREILTVSRECGAELIVVGTASASAMFGSTAHDVVRRAEIPVLVVPPSENA
jgi:nucleotide-binding universal stress UspA family protein